MLHIAALFPSVLLLLLAATSSAAAGETAGNSCSAIDGMRGGGAVPEPSLGPPYGAAADAGRDGASPPGATRSRNGPGYALIAPDSRVFGDPPLGWVSAPGGGRIPTAAAVVTPAMGSHFAMYLVRVPQAARFPLTTVLPGALPGLERFLFLLTGTVTTRCDGNSSSNPDPDGRIWSSGSYLYLPPGNSTELVLTATEDSSLIQIDRVYSYPAGHPVVPESVCGFVDHVSVEVPPGEMFRLRRLLNVSNPANDFNIHIMDFEPGQYLVTKEMHYNQHGLMILAGEGIYMLGADFMPVKAGDFVWMAPFCLQWYAALGSSGTRYFLYKDTRTDPLRHVTAPIISLSRQ